MEADVTRFRDYRGPSAGYGKRKWIKRKIVKNILNVKRNEIIIIFLNLLFPILFVFDYFLCSADYFYYYQNVTNDDIIKLHQKFHSDFLLFGYTLPGFLNKDERRY